MQFKISLARRLKTLILGDARSPQDRAIFHKISLIAFFALDWVRIGWSLLFLLWSGRSLSGIAGISLLGHLCGFGFGVDNFCD